MSEAAMALAPWIAAQRKSLLAQRGHAWLLQGPSGLGQYALGLEMVRAWLCDNAPTLPAARGSLPPEGAFAPWGGPAALTLRSVAPALSSGSTASDHTARLAGSKRSTRGSFTSVRSVGRTMATFSRTSSAALRPSMCS